MLRRFGFMFAGAFDVRHQCDMNEAAVLPAVLQTDLTDRLQERLALDISYCAADLRDDNVAVAFLSYVVYEVLDFIRDMRDDLNRAPEILPFPLFVQHIPVDFPCRQIGEFIEVLIDESFVMAKVQIRFGSVLCDVHLSMLEGAHGPRVNIDVRVQFLRDHLQTAGFQKPAQ